MAPQGDVTVEALQVNILSANNTSSFEQQTHYSQTGVTLSISNPVISAVQTGQQMATAASQTSDPRMQALAAASTALAANHAYETVNAGQDTKDGNLADKAGGINLSVSLGSSQSQSSSTSNSSNVVGSLVQAGNNLTIQATGSQTTPGDLTVIGSQLSAGNNALLAAADNLNLFAAANTSSSQGSSSGSGASIGVGYSLGAKNGVAVTVSSNSSQGNSNGNDILYTNTLVTAGNTASLSSSNDTTLKGAQVIAKQVMADVGGNLQIETLQDTSTYQENGSSSGFSLTVPITGNGWGVSGGLGQTKIDSNYRSANQQSGIQAGDGGFQVDVVGNTDLKGGLIASSQKAIDEGNNLLITGTLTTSDLQNQASYSGQSTNLGLGYSSDGKGIGTNSTGQPTAGTGQTPGSTLPSLDGWSATPPVALSASGETSGTTKSAISQGSIIVTDDAKQQVLTGKDSATTVASLNHDTRNANGSIAPIFDKDEIKAGFEITQTLVQQVGTFVNDQASKIDAKTQEAKSKDQSADVKQAQADALADGPERNQLLQEADQLRQEAISARIDAKGLEEQWGAGGTYRQVLGAVTAAATGNVTSGSTDFLQSTIVNLVQAKAAQEIKQLAEDLGIPEGSPAHAALHAINACIGAAGQGGNCGAAALGAASAAVAGALLIDAESLTNEQKEARKNLVATLVTGIAAANNASAAATTAALIELENNSNVKSAVKAAINDAKTYLNTKAQQGGEKVVQLLEKLEIQSLVDKQKTIEEFINAAASRGGLTDPELAVLATLYAANQVLFPTSVLDALPGIGKAVTKAGDLVKIGVGTERAVKVATAEAKTDKLGVVETRLSGPVFQTTKEATVAAAELGYRKINETVHNGQAVYRKGNLYITRDLDGHNGGAWKMANSISGLESRETRLGTFDRNLNFIGDWCEWTEDKWAPCMGYAWKDDPTIDIWVKLLRESRYADWTLYWLWTNLRAN